MALVMYLRRVRWALRGKVEHRRNNAGGGNGTRLNVPCLKEGERKKRRVPKTRLRLLNVDDYHEEDHLLDVAPVVVHIE